jgi:hypothetical protein
MVADNFEVIRAGIRVLQKGVTHNDKKETVTRTVVTLNRVLDEIERELVQAKGDVERLV